MRFSQAGPEGLERGRRPAIWLAPIAMVGMLICGRAARASDAIALPAFTGSENGWILFALFAGIVSLLTGSLWYAQIKRLDAGTAEMQEVGKAIRNGAFAYLQKQITTMFPLVVVVAALLFLLYRGQSALGYTPREAFGVSVFFILGVAASYLSGYVGMGMATLANQRTADQARRTFKGALETALKAGAVSGMMTVGMGLVGACLVFLLYREKAMLILIGFGFGGSLAALFMRVGGGIFTKAADVGADLVGKYESGIPEDDPRNPATIADNVGDHVGDCAGMAADVFESYVVMLVASIILAAATIPGSVTGADSALQHSVLQLVMYPLIVCAGGIFASILGVFAVRGADKEDFDPMKPINTGFYVSAGCATLFFLLGSYFYFRNGVEIPVRDGINNGAREIVPWWRFFLCTGVGIALALVIGRLTEYFTSTEKKPVREVVYASRTGPATMIISGFSSGLESAVWSAVAIALTLLFALAMFPANPTLAAYGIALAGLGMLTTTGYILAMDTFGPITDNANGIFEMSGVLEADRKNGMAAGAGGITGDRIVGRLDAVGNTTKALTKGFAIATAVIAAVALFRSFMTDAGLLDIGIRLERPEVFIGLLIGGAAPFLFSSFAINAVGRAAIRLIEEVRRQFRSDAGILAGTSKPNYAQCVEIVTTAAQQELLGPGVLAIGLPILVGFGMGFGDPKTGAAALGGYLAGAIVSGQLLAVLLSNSGGAWDNAKKKIEDGFLNRKPGDDYGKGSDNHKAAIVCDTVGDPFKDTAGPALNPLIKVMNLTGLLIAGIVIQDIAPGTRALICGVAALALGLAIAWSKRGSNADGGAPTQSTPPSTLLPREDILIGGGSQ